ncbi:hypothetical protein P3T76_014603 [Phytophthora citrophthora]|uniref:Uncharacterized protein n=1 Tax=Phytophthora citrophthora TaxID=4793 RepID=A0AAD9G124_9STRA|nr:hypothetical protein P3T76_014603 [Phytophthora citrophthora]
MDVMQLEEQKYSKWSTRNIVEHGLLRDVEQVFPSVQFHEGVPFVDWTTLSSKMDHGAWQQL